MIPLVIAAVVGIIFFVIVFTIGSRMGTGTVETRQRTALDRIYQDAGVQERVQEKKILIRRDAAADVTNPLGKSLLKIGMFRTVYELMLKAGYYGRVQTVITVCFVLFLIITTLIATKTKFAAFSVFIAFGIVWILLKRYLKGKIRKRNEQFISIFPDAIDIIVRSVRAGHPLNTALRMISENSDPPVSTEFKQVVDEISYGRTLIEALGRLSLRIDEPDLQFFIVVLSVQQETGSNLAEVLGNLSDVIRKRKQLRMKIKAMTSEGRATAYVLGALPILVFGALTVVSPKYLQPLYDTTAGNILFAGSAGLIILAFVICNQMVKIDI